MTSPDEEQTNGPYTENEEALLEYCKLDLCASVMGRASHALYFSRLVERLRNEPSAAYMMMAYAAGYRVDFGTEFETQYNALATVSKAKSLALVNERITRDGGIQGASDENIQAVLFLLAYETRYGKPQEADVHLSGLRGMIQERGGLRAFEQHATLRHQLLWVELTGTAMMVLECAADCEGRWSGPLATVYHFKRISLVDSGPRAEVAESFIHKLRLFQGHDHVSMVRSVLRHLTPLYQFASATLEDIQVREPATSWSAALTDCRTACLFYINTLILKSSGSVQRVRAVLDNAVLQHYCVDYPTSESPFGLLWVFLDCLPLEDERNRETLWMVIEMMQALRLLTTPRLKMVEYLLLQILFHPEHLTNASLALNETEIINDILTIR